MTDTVRFSFSSATRWSIGAIQNPSIKHFKIKSIKVVLIYILCVCSYSFSLICRNQLVNHLDGFATGLLIFLLNVLLKISVFTSSLFSVYRTWLLASDNRLYNKTTGHHIKAFVSDIHWCSISILMSFQVLRGSHFDTCSIFRCMLGKVYGYAPVLIESVLYRFGLITPMGVHTLM